MKIIITFTRNLSVFLLFFFFSCSSKNPPDKPNILFIMSDDHAVSAIGCYDRRLADIARTANIDKLASQGMRFDKCFVTNSICSPSRATILTGKYNHKNGVYCLDQEFKEQPTSASILQNAGYQTAVFGKWHLKSIPVGYDDYKILERQGKYQDPEFIEKNSDSLVTRKGWVDDLVSEMTMNFIHYRDKSKPFYVLTHFKSAHDPWDSRSPFDTAYTGFKVPEPENLCDDYVHRSQAAHRTTLKLELLNQGTFPHQKLDTSDICAQRKFIYQQYIKAYLQSARMIDDNVGKLMDFLASEGLEENTVVIYTSDQGHFLGEHGFFSKRFIYEESIHMPLIVRFPGKVQAGKVNHDLIINADFAPTIVDVAGISVPDDMQGQSLKDALYNQTEIDRDAIYYRYWQHLLHRDVTAHYGIRTKDYKLIYYYGLPLGQTDFAPTEPEWEMFDLQKDPDEMHNVYNDLAYKEITLDLKNQMEGLKDKYDDQDDQYPEMVKINAEYYKSQY